MHIEFLCISEVAAGTKTMLHNKFMKAICTVVRIDCVNPTYATQLLIFCQIITLTITLTLHCSSTMVGGHEKQNDSNTAASSSSASASAVSADWECAPPLQNVCVDTQYIGVIEEQKQQIKHLQEELAEFNCVRYRILLANASRG
jgi:hypothetical protein